MIILITQVWDGPEFGKSLLRNMWTLPNEGHKKM